MKYLFHERLKELRAKKKISQQKLADELSLSRGRIGNYEQGTREPDNDMIVLFANYFNVSTDYLLGITADPKPKTKYTEIESTDGRRIFEIHDDQPSRSYGEMSEELKKAFGTTKGKFDEALETLSEEGKARLLATLELSIDMELFKEATKKKEQK